MKYVKKTKPAPWTLAFPDQVEIKEPKKRKNYSMSKKRKAESKIYNQMRIPFLTEHPFCMRCGDPAQCVHHWSGRGKNYLKIETWRAACIKCNNFAKTHPSESRRDLWIAPLGEYCFG